MLQRDWADSDEQEQLKSETVQKKKFDPQRVFQIVVRAASAAKEMAIVHDLFERVAQELEVLDDCPQKDDASKALLVLMEKFVDTHELTTLRKIREEEAADG